MDGIRPEEIKKHAIEFTKYCRRYWYLCIMAGAKIENDEERSKMTEKSLDTLYDEFNDKKPVSL